MAGILAAKCKCSFWKKVNTIQGTGQKFIYRALHHKKEEI